MINGKLELTIMVVLWLAMFVGAALFASTAGASVIKSTGTWEHYNEEPDPFTKKARKNITQSGFYSGNLFFSLGAECGLAGFYIQGVIDKDSEDSIKIKFDDLEAVELSVTYIEVNDTDGLMFTSGAKDIIEKMKMHDTLFLEVYLYKNDRHVFEFQLKDFSEQYDKLGC